MLIPKETIAEINRKADIVDVISDYVALQPSGANYKGLCPFHKEKTPSFSVNRTDGFYHCFGCKESGTSITFLQKYLNIPFIEAVKMLAIRYGIKIESKYDDKADSEESLLYRLYDSAKDFYIAELYRVGEKAFEYYKQRNLSDNSIVKFALGYAPNNFERLTKHFAHSDYSTEILIKSGLLRKNEKGKYDFFRNRTMFPIRDFIGRTIAFGGRQLEKNDKSGKYINSPDSLIYNKKQTLYGLYEGKTEIRKTKTTFVVEGYLDVISLSQSGIYNVVAPCGTSLSLEQLRSLKKHTGCEILYFMFDGDEAGKNAAFRGIEIALKLGFDLRLIDLPEGQDPDSFINTADGRKKFNTIYNESKNFVEYIYHTLNDKNLLNTPAEKSTTIRNLLKLVLFHPDKLQHKYYTDFIVDLFKVDVEELRKLYVKMRNELKESNLRSSLVSINKNDLQDLNEPETTIDNFTTISNITLEEKKIDNNFIEKEELLPAERAVFSYILRHNDNFKISQEKYEFNENILLSGLAKDIYYWFTEYEDSENIFQSLLEDEDVPDNIKNILSELKMYEIKESKHWNKYSNIKAVNNDTALIKIPLLQLKDTQYLNEMEELQKKMKANYTDERILKHFYEILEKHKKFMEYMNKF